VATAGILASSDRLVKDPAVLFPWIQTARHLFAVEMESSGAYRAARDRAFMLAIRRISDIIGLKRDQRVDEVRVCFCRRLCSRVPTHHAGCAQEEGRLLNGCPHKASGAAERTER
jgi:hypothetical protein